MNRIYTTLSSVALSVAAFTVSAELSPVQLAVGASPAAVVPASPSRADEADKKPGEVDEAIVSGGWKNIGKGMWYEDLLCAYEDFMDATGTNWQVDIEESETVPGYYRILPYYEGTIIAELNWEADWNYIYIDATDPEKVVAKDFAPYDYFLMSHTVPENGWSEDASKGYGKLEEGIITFPLNAFSAYIDIYGEWMLTSFNDGVRIALPGAKITDYSIHYSLDFCQVSSDVEFTLTYGASAAKAVGGVYKGFYAGSEENIASVAKTDKELTGGEQSYSLSDGMYTFFVILLDADGNVAASKVSNFFVYNDDKSAWEDIGTVDYSDDIYGSAYESVIPSTQSHKVIIERNIKNPSLYRLKNPYYTSWEYYTRFNLHLDRHYHTHYIEIDASDPDKVVMRSSNLGVNVTFAGYGIVESLPTFNESLGRPAGNLYGTLKNGVISFPANSLVFYEHGNPNAYVVNRNARMNFVLPATSAIEDVEEDTEGGMSAPVYYDLTGRVTANPVKGSLYIKRIGSKAEKVVF